MKPKSKLAEQVETAIPHFRFQSRLVTPSGTSLKVSIEEYWSVRRACGSIFQH